MLPVPVPIILHIGVTQVSERSCMPHSPAQAGHKSKPLVHDVTLVPRHLLSKGHSVTEVSGIRCYLSLRKDTRSALIRGPSTVNVIRFTACSLR
jgi:hypothetical protein